MLSINFHRIPAIDGRTDRRQDERITSSALPVLRWLYESLTRSLALQWCISGENFRMAARLRISSPQQWYSAGGRRRAGVSMPLGFHSAEEEDARPVAVASLDAADDQSAVSTTSASRQRQLRRTSASCARLRHVAANFHQDQSAVDYVCTVCNAICRQVSFRAINTTKILFTHRNVPLQPANSLTFTKQCMYVTRYKDVTFVLLFYIQVWHLPPLKITTSRTWLIFFVSGDYVTSSQISLRLYEFSSWQRYDSDVTMSSSKCIHDVTSNGINEPIQRRNWIKWRFSLLLLITQVSTRGHIVAWVYGVGGGFN